jgi:Domain of unknown function (DUF4328)
MSQLLTALPLLLMLVYLGLAVRMVPVVLGGGDLRKRIRVVWRFGPAELLRETYRSALVLLIGFIVLLVAANSYRDHLAYQASPSCGSAATADCRAMSQLMVASVTVQSARSGDETVVSFAGNNGSATFRYDDVPAWKVPVGSTVPAEVWRGQVTAISIGGTKHESFATQSDAWIGVAAGGLLVLVGVVWLMIDIADESSAVAAGVVRETFASPVLRRRALYVLLAVFGGLLVLLGLAFVAIEMNADSTANTLAAIYFIGGLLMIPVIVLVFVSWLARAYSNLSALGLKARHSGWFVIAAMLVPPFSLFMPYRLLEEMVRGTAAPVSERVLKNWWISALAWLGLTALGISLGSPNPRDPSLSNQLSNAMMIASVLVGLFGVWLTVRLISAIDRAEFAIADRQRRR